MPELIIQIGGRDFEVSCQAGEEPYLEAAARLLDNEAQVVSQEIGRMPEARMLLMAGLLLADKAGALEERARMAEDELAKLQARPAPAPARVEVPVVPEAVVDTLAELAARIEALADAMEESAGDALDGIRSKQPDSP